MRSLSLITRLVAIGFIALPMNSISGAVDHEHNQSLAVDSEPEIPSDIYFAGITASSSATASLPTLDYWGVQKVVWGASESELVKVAPGMAVSAKLSNVKVANCQLGGLRCETKMEFDSKGKLSAIRKEFAQGHVDRHQRLGMYRVLLSTLTKKYSLPSRQMFPEEKVRGEDAYVQGLDEKYHVGWVGSETDVDLVLSDRELSVVFRPSEFSQATEHRKRMEQFEAIRKDLPANHPLNQIGRQ